MAKHLQNDKLQDTQQAHQQGGRQPMGNTGIM
jgi:hypothetical protein